MGKAEDDALINAEFEKARKEKSEAIHLHVSNGAAALYEAANIVVETYVDWDFQKTKLFYNMVVFVRKVKGVDSLLVAIEAFQSRAQLFVSLERKNRVLDMVKEAKDCWAAALGVENTASTKKKKAGRMRTPQHRPTLAPGPYAK